MAAIVCLIGFFGFFAYLAKLLICVIKKKPKKRSGLGMLICFILCFGGAAMMPDSGDKPAVTEPSSPAQSVSLPVDQKTGSQSEPPAQNTPDQADPDPVDPSLNTPTLEDKAKDYLSEQFELDLTNFQESGAGFEATISVEGVSDRADQTQAPEDWQDIQLRMISAQARMSETLEEPEKETKLYLRDTNNELMLTVQNGEIIFDKYKETPKPEQSSNGSSIGSSGGNGSNFNTYDNPSQQQTSASYVLNTNTMKFHHPSCSSVAKIAPENYSTYNGTRDGAISKGYDPCGICKP